MKKLLLSKFSIYTHRRKGNRISGKVYSGILLCMIALFISSASTSLYGAPSSEKVLFGNGTLELTPMQDNAIRVQFKKHYLGKLPEWVYTNTQTANTSYKRKDSKSETVIVMKQMTVRVNHKSGKLTIQNSNGSTVFAATAHELTPTVIQQDSSYVARLAIESPEDEYLFGLGQFQDGYSNVRGLSRRLTQVNTQIAVPFLLSSKGYGMLWNNYGLTEFNPSDEAVTLVEESASGNRTVVDVTSTEGTKKEVREDNVFKGRLNIASDGKYAILLDVGQSMARRHHLTIDDKCVIDMQNLWLPPTTSVIVELKAGQHELTALLEKDDQPTLYYKKIDNQTVFRSPLAECVDYTVFVGSADEVISSYRNITGTPPMMPKWALGYIHCRERFHSQQELLETAEHFRNEQLPIDVIVQDWQYWGRYGWNSMQFDEKDYPQPADMVKQLHDMNMRLMLSVWSKIDPNSEVGKQAQANGFYIPETSWIDFFNPDAASFYWKNFNSRLLKPYQIDAWWQDATEPENDDLVGRRVMNGRYPGEIFRNVYPLLVNKTVYEGCRKDDGGRRTMILTRSGFPGIQRYGSALWSGDVGNDWETLRRQLAAGLNLVSTGLPWWTYDAGGFFRPRDQYSNSDYIERMIRWIQAGTFLPLMRVHGYMSDTEPWRYGEQAKQIIGDYMRLRYRLLPYIYSEASEVTFNGSTLMRPLIFDFAYDQEALKQAHEYMFGHSLLINPVTENNVSSWRTYLPSCKAGWYDFWSGKKYDGEQYIDAPVTIERIPVFVKGGTLLPVGPDKQYTAEQTGKPMGIQIYPGADASFCLYEDEGNNYNYEKGDYSRINFHWDDKKSILTIDNRQGSYAGMETNRQFRVMLSGIEKIVQYKGEKVKVKFED